MNIETKFSRTPPPERVIGPVVELPRSGIPSVIIFVLAAALAVLLFIILNAERKRAALHPAQAQGSGTSAFVAAPPLFVPPEAPNSEPETGTPPTPPQSTAPKVAPATLSPVTPAVTPIVTSAPVPPSAVPPPSVPMGIPPAPLPPAPASDSEPALIIDSGTAVGAVADTASDQPPPPPGTNAPLQGSVHNLGKNSRLTDLTTSMAAGTMIPAVLETPVDTSRPGLVRAIVSQDARGYDGRRVLIPRGSRLIGECGGETKSGQSRVLVTWQRVILPDGRTFELDSPAADSLGGSGIPGHVHGFFLARFLNSALQSALYVGETLLGRGPRTTVVVGATNSAVPTAAAQGFSNGPQPKITVASGALINVYVAHDIDFSNTSAGR